MSNGATFQRIRSRIESDDSPALLVCSDAQGVPVAANLSARRFVPAEGISSWSDLFVPPDHEVWGAAIRRSCVDNTPLCGSYRLRRFDNAVREFVVRAEPRYDESGVFVGHVVSAMDISEISLMESSESGSVQEIIGNWHDRLVSTATVVSASADLIQDLLPQETSPVCRAAMQKLKTAVSDLRAQIQTLSSVSRSRE